MTTKQQILEQRRPDVLEEVQREQGGPRYVVVHAGKSRKQRRAEKAQQRREKKGGTK